MPSVRGFWAASAINRNVLGFQADPLHWLWPARIRNYLARPYSATAANLRLADIMTGEYHVPDKW